jgi:hypothetical protein
MKQLVLAVLASGFVILGGHSLRAEIVLIGSLDCEVNRGSAFTTTGQCIYLPVFGLFPPTYRADMRRIVVQQILVRPAHAIWGVYGPPLTFSLAGTYFRAAGSQRLIGGPGNPVVLHPLSATWGDNSGGPNLARSVSRLTLH